ncbi:LysM peptidoglycan-binding domain-containing protein, partial [bacterium]|nr:LysM peptidoglycan-binding domain-containing protein [bacterium]
MSFGKLLTILSLGFILLGSAPARADVVYSIRTGDTLDKISSRYNVSVSQITELNPQLKGKTGALPVGLIVIIPSASEATSAKAAEEDMTLAMLEEAPPTLNRVDLAAARINRAGD